MKIQSTEEGHKWVSMWYLDGYISGISLDQMANNFPIFYTGKNW